MRDVIVTQNITLDGVIESTEGWFDPAGGEDDESDVETALRKQRDSPIQSCPGAADGCSRTRPRSAPASGCRPSLFARASCSCATGQPDGAPASRCAASAFDRCPPAESVGLRRAASPRRV